MEHIDWLRAQLDADEGTAAGVHDADCQLHNWLRADQPSACDCGWPKRVLAEVEAKRQILDSYAHHAGRAKEAKERGEQAHAIENIRDALWFAVRALALPYAGRPGYSELFGA